MYYDDIGVDVKASIHLKLNDICISYVCERLYSPYGIELNRKLTENKQSVMLCLYACGPRIGFSGPIKLQIKWKLIPQPSVYLLTY